MSDEKPWLTEDCPDDVRELLSAARAEEPSGRAVGSTLAALGVASAAVTAASHAAGATAGSAALASATKGAGAATSLSLALKWGFIGAATGVTTLVAGSFAVGALSPPAPAPTVEVHSPAATPRPAVAPAAPAVASSSEPAVDEAVVPEEPPAASRGRIDRLERTAPAAEPAPVPSPAASSERMLREVSAIDGARALLGRGDARGALAALDRYPTEFPERRFEPESLYIRMEACRVLGDVGGARSAADRLLRTFPSAPQAARARAFIGVR